MAGARTWLAVMAIVPTLLLAACTDEPPPPTTTATPPPTTPPTTSSTRADPADEVPPVRQPLDDAALVAAPCSSLTAPQLAELQLGKGYDERTSVCTFPDLDPATELVVFLIYFEHDDGLGDLYNLRPPGNLWADWTPMEVDGYPAVRFRDYKTANVCDIGVGTSDTTYFHVQVVDPDVGAGRDTCGMVTAIGTAVLATVKAAN